MSRPPRFLLATLVTLSLWAAAPARSEYVYADYGPHRYLSGTMLKSGVRANFFGYTATGARAYSFFGEPGGEPYVEEMFGGVEVIKGTARREAWGSFTVTFDPALATAKIKGTIDGVSIDVTLTALTAAPIHHVYVPGPEDVQPPDFVDLYTGAEAGRPAAAAGSASATGVGGITGGTGTGEIRAGFGGGIFYWDF